MKNNVTTVEYSLTLNNKKHTYKLTKVDDSTTKVECPSAWISQVFDNEDLPELLLHLPDYILEKEAESKNDKPTVIRIRVLTSEKNAIKRLAVKNGYRNMSSYLKEKAFT